MAGKAEESFLVRCSRAELEAFDGVRPATVSRAELVRRLMVGEVARVEAERASVPVVIPGQTELTDAIDAASPGGRRRVTRLISRS